MRLINHIALLFIDKALAVHTYGDSGGIPTRFDYRQTFKYPISSNSSSIPYFNTTGDVLKNKDFVRLVPSMDYQLGSIWATTANPHKEWMVEMSVIVSGMFHLGGDGFVFWYSDDQKQPGMVSDFYGRHSEFTGVAIVFDTGDLNTNRINPYVYAIENNGRKSAKDFKDYMSENVHLGACHMDYRNTMKPVWIKIMYHKNMLSLDMDIRQGGKSYSNCFKFPIHLPSGYHFSLSATTSKDGGRDDHDILSFETYELNPAPPKSHPERPHEAEMIKEGKKFEMTDELKKYIQETESKVENLTHVEEDPTERDDPFHQIKENQLHIIQALDAIQDVVLTHKTDHKAGLKDTESHIETMRTELDELKADLHELHGAIKQLDQVSRQLHQAVVHEVGTQSETLRGHREQADHVGTALKYFAILAGISLIGMTYGICIRSAKSKEKKFV